MMRRYAAMRRLTLRRLSVLLLSAAMLVCLYLYLPPVKAFVVGALQAGCDPSALERLVVSYRGVAPLIILLLTLLQAAITVLPLCVVMMVSTMVLGLSRGVAVSVVSQVIAGYLTMRLTRSFGRPFVERFVSGSKMASLNNLIERRGMYGVLVARLIPFGSFDLVNFAAGLLNVGDGDFVLGTLFGVIPATSFYGLIGANLLRLDRISSTVYGALAGLIALAMLFAMAVCHNER